MSSLKRWRQIGQGQFHKWETPGDEFEGTWRGMHDGRFGPLGTLETLEGLVTFPLHAALLERLKLVREGAAYALAPPTPSEIRQMICEPASYYYRVMTRSHWMPVLIGERF